MSLPTDGGLDTMPPAVAALTPSKEPCPAGPDVPREGSREIQKRGKVISVAYDWCKSKKKPVAYRIWCWQADAGNLANTVRQTDCRSHVQGSYVKVCYGDEPGTGGGVKSGTCQAECTPLTWSPSVRAEGRPMVRRFDKWHMNHGNTWGCLENPEDTGTYNAPKVASIDPQMVPSSASIYQASNRGAVSSGEDDNSAAPGMKAAQSGGLSIPLDAQSFQAYEGQLPGGTTPNVQACPDLRQPPKPRPKPDEDPPRPPPIPPPIRITGDGCCIAPYFKNKPKTSGGDGGCDQCKPGENAAAHHGMIDYPFRTGTAEMPGHQAPGGGNYENALTICVPKEDHDALHGGLRKAIRDSRVGGIITFADVKKASFDEIDNLPDSVISESCKNEYKKRLESDYQMPDDTPLRAYQNQTVKEGSTVGDILSKAWNFTW